MSKIKNTICELCNKKFRYARDLRRHRARKTPCTPILEITDLSQKEQEDPDLKRKKCPFCGRTYVSYNSMRQHVRKSCKIAPNEKNGDRGMELLYEYTNRKQQAQIDELKKQNTEMLTLVRQIAHQGSSSKLSTSTTNQAKEGGVIVQGGNKNTVVVDNKRVVINVFGKENVSHITKADIKAILDDSITKGLIADAATAAVQKAAMMTYSDPVHPENLTCYLSNKKTNDALVHTENGWEVQPASLILVPMAAQSINELFEKQPLEGAEKYDSLMRELRDNENKHLSNTAALRAILVRNKKLLKAALAQKIKPDP